MAGESAPGRHRPQRRDDPTLWIGRCNDGTATSEDFETLYEEVSDQYLGEFYDSWLRRPEKPTDW